MNSALQRAPGSQLLRVQGHRHPQTRLTRPGALPVRCQALQRAHPAVTAASSSAAAAVSAAAAAPCFSGGMQQQRQRRSVACNAADAAMPMPGSAAPAVPSAGGLTKVLSNVRALLFAAWTFTLAIPLFLTMIVMSPVVLLTDKFRRLAQHFVNNLWAIASTTPFYGVTIRGRENLPPAGSPAVYVANHQSFMDIYSLFHLQRPFKFISKTSNFMIPIVGWSMFLTGHVMLNRVDRRSQLKCLQTCIELLGKDASVLFFPEGTRSKDKVMGGFKKGAFSVAVKAKAPVVPITLIGTGDVMPSGKEGQMFAGHVTIVVHPMIPTDGADADAVCDEARRVIASALPAELVGDSSVMTSE